MVQHYALQEGWVFASDSYRAGVKRGKQPYRPSTIMRHFIQPVAKKTGLWQHQLAHVPPYLLDTLVCQWSRSQGGAGTAAAFVDQGHDGCLNAGGHSVQAEGSVARGLDDGAEEASWGYGAGLALHTVTMNRRRPINVTFLESWRPRRDLNPCYRRERAKLSRK